MHEHLFGECDPTWCQHDDKRKVKSGSAVTCPVQQAQISQLVKQRILDKLDQIVIDGIGASQQCACCVYASYVSRGVGRVSVNVSRLK